MLYILPYKLASVSARTLARSLGVKRLFPDSSYIPKAHDIVVNWGCSTKYLGNARVLNVTGAVAIAKNKLLSLQMFERHAVSTVPFTTDPRVAQEWLDLGFKVMARHKLESCSGEGIQLIRQGEALPAAKLYTRYVRKEHEYRVHVFNGQVIDYTQKKRKLEGLVDDSLATFVRSHSNGWVFARQDVVLPEEVRLQAIKAVASLGLHFGGVDIGYRNGKATVFEVNSAPGVEGTTLDAYISAINSYRREGRHAA